jgi:transcription elongation GreA/GreB family factor
MPYILNHQPVSNLDKVIEFEYEGMRMVRKLVVTVREFGEEISVASPVGFRLANAKVDEVFTVTRPDPDGYSVGKVLVISESVPQVKA